MRGHQGCLKMLSSQHDAHVRAARNSDRSPRSHVRARAVRAKCSLAGLTTKNAALQPRAQRAQALVR